MKNVAIILGAGKSTRCGFDKLFTGKFGKPVIYQTLEKFEACEDVDEIVLVLSDERTRLPENEDLKKCFSKISQIVAGCEERFFSLQNAIEVLEKKENCRIIVHNAANPNITAKEISAGIAKAKEKKNIIFGFFTPNSIKEVDKSGKVNKFLDREQIFETQTPQISDLKTFREAISNLESNPGSNLSRSPEPGFVIPRDEAELLAEIGEDIYIFECSPQNQKMTFAHDFNTNPGSDLFSKFSEPGFENLRIGIGEDSHRFVQEFDDKNPVILGGIKFPECEQSFDANSDGDVILHALCNAILSPVGEKTLDSFADEMCKDGITDSREYLKKALEIVQKKFEGFEIFNVVISLECKMPKIAPRHDEVQESLAELLGIEVDKVGLTYTTGEGLSCFGEGKGVRALVKVLAKI